MTSGDLNACCSKKNAYRYGTFKRSSDSQNVQRFQCKTCKKTFSLATFDPQYYQKKRHLNYAVMMMLASGVSMRRIRILLNINLKTVARKLQYLGPDIYFSSDECTYYAPVVKRYFPQARHRQFKGEKSANTGQGELKSID